MRSRWLTLVFMAMAVNVLAQDAFEVASVRRNTSGEARMSFGFEPGGRPVMVNTPVRMLLLQAYLVPGSRIVGGPAWVDTERYDITAKAETDAPSERLRLMARTLLADRFKLTAHFEDRDQQTFALVVARPGVLGPRLRTASVDCTPRGACRTSHETNTGTLTSSGTTMTARGPVPVLVIDRIERPVND
jgi:uncharacterized protein (TIGR03435 family)